MTTNELLNATSLAEPIAAVNKSHQQLPPQRSLRARTSSKTFMQSPPEQKGSTHNTTHSNNEISNNDDEKNNKILLEEKRGSALVSEIMRRLSRAQPALPSHDIHIHDTSNLSEDMDHYKENNNNNTNSNDDMYDNKDTDTTTKKTLSDLPILRIPVPPSILKTSNDSVPHRVEGRKIQFIDPILSNSSSEVDSTSRTSSFLLEQTPDKRLDTHDPVSTFIVASDNNNNREGSREPLEMNAYYSDNTPLKENAIIISSAMQSSSNNNGTTLNNANTNINENNINKENNATFTSLSRSLSTPESSSSSLESSSSIMSSPAFNSLETTPYRHETLHLPSSLATPAQVHPLMETNRPQLNNNNSTNNKQQTTPQSLNITNSNHTQIVLEEVHRAAPLPARPRMSREPTSSKNEPITNNDNKLSKSDNKVNEKAEKAKPSTVQEHNENERGGKTDKNDVQKFINDNDETKTQHSDYDNFISNTLTEEQPAKQDDSNNSQNVEGKNSSSNTINNSDEDHFSIPPFRHGQQGISLSNAAQTTLPTELTKEELLRQLQKYEEEVRQNAERSLRPSGQSLEQTHPVSISPTEVLLPVANTVKQTETVNVQKNTHASKVGATDSKKENKLNVENEKLCTNTRKQHNNTVEVPLINTSLTPELEEEESPHVPSLNQTGNQHIELKDKIENHYNNNPANSLVNQQVKMQMQSAPEQSEQNINTKQHQTQSEQVEKGYGSDSTESMFYLLLYNQLTGSTSKHSLEYLMNRWEKRQKRDLAKRMEEVIGVDAHLRQHHIKEKSKHKKHHKSRSNTKQEHHRKKEKSDSKKHKSVKENKRHYAHKHKETSPHQHHHRHHHRQHTQENIKEEKDKVDLQESTNKQVDDKNNKKTGKKIVQNPEASFPVDAMNDVAPHDNNYDDINITNVNDTTEKLGKDEQRIDYKNLSLEELKAAARRYGLEFIEKATHWEQESHQTLPSFTSRPTSPLHTNHNYYHYSSNRRPSASSYLQERQTRIALREKYLGRRTLSPSTNLDKHIYNNNMMNNTTTPWQRKEGTRSNIFDSHHDLWSKYSHTSISNNMDNVNNNNSKHHYFWEQKGNDTNDNDDVNDNNKKRSYWNAHVEDDEVHSYHSYHDNLDVDHEFYQSSSSPFLSSRHEQFVPRSSYYQPMHRTNSVTKRRFASPLPPPTPDANTSPPSIYSDSMYNRYHDVQSKINGVAENNENLQTFTHTDLPVFEVRDLRAARELASGVKTMIHSLKSYVNLT